MNSGQKSFKKNYGPKSNDSGDINRILVMRLGGIGFKGN